MSAIQVLVVSSDVERRAMLADILRECGLQAVFASNAKEVRIILFQSSIDFVFCEDNLPERDFREVLRLARAKRPEAKVVMSSLLREWEEYLEAMQPGGFGFEVPA